MLAVKSWYRGAVVVGFLGLAASAILHDKAIPGESPGYSLLSLDGVNVKWGTPHLGTPAVVRYAFLKAPLTRKEGTNCRSMSPFPDRFVNGGVEYPEITAEFRAAFAAWQSVAAVRFEEVHDPENADLVLGVQDSPAGVAYADVIPDGNRPAPIVSIRNAAICFNPNIHWKTAFDGNEKTYDVRYVALHETGHVIGLDHPWGPPGTIMNVKYKEVSRLPRANDAAGARQLYGMPAQLNAEHTTSQPPLSLLLRQSADDLKPPTPKPEAMRRGTEPSPIRLLRTIAD